MNRRLSFTCQISVTTASSRRHVALSSNRPNVLICCEKRISDGDRGDPEWMKIAKSIGALKKCDASKNDDQQIESRPSPRWTYPDGDPRDFGEGENPWHLWNTTQSPQDQELSPRDPQAETDFWRATARDVNVNMSSGASLPADDNDSSKNIWKMAREVTGDMTQLRDRLRDELNNYDTTENRDQYREIARQLVGPSEDEPWNDKDSTQAKGCDDARIGWNPDVDWMRFDDVRRADILEQEAAQRRSVEDVARQSKRDSFGSTAEQQQQTGDIFSKNSPSFQFNRSSPTDANFTVNGNTPGFLRNRFRNGTYGSSWSGLEEEALKLKREGVEMRDPQRDTESWRSAAKELVGSFISISTDGTSPDESTLTSPLGPREDVKSDISSIPEQALNASSEEESSSWSAWQAGNQKWMIANADLKERDPKKEVDMWRSSARELTSTAGDSFNSNLSSNNTAGPQGDVSAWDQWRSANDKWKAGLTSEQKSANNPFVVGAQSAYQENADWGSGLGRTNSERSAWENWNRVAIMDSGGDGKMWWDTRIDSSSRNELRASDEDLLVKPEIKIDGEKNERIEKNSSLGEWRSIAKELGGGPQ